MTDVERTDPLDEAVARALEGGPERHRGKAADQGKLPVRERVALLLDEGSFAEDGLLASWEEDGLGAEGVITGTARSAGRPVAVMANDPTVKAGSWGRRPSRRSSASRRARSRCACPLVYLVDSAGARITDQVQMFPGRRGAGRIFYNQVQMSGLVPQVCLLFGPSAAGGAYIPAFCDIVMMGDGNARMYLGSPRMAEMVIGEKVTLEEMGGAQMHCSVSGCGDVLVQGRGGRSPSRDATSRFFPESLGARRRRAPRAAAADGDGKRIEDIDPGRTRTSRSTCARHRRVRGRRLVARDQGRSSRAR